ncbi:hypothetical protein PT2222_290090 [Paraburkholderia tropica]
MKVASYGGSNGIDVLETGRCGLFQVAIYGSKQRLPPVGRFSSARHGRRRPRLNGQNPISVHLWVTLF